MVLVLGLFTRVGGLVGVLLPLNYMAARGALESASGWGTADASLALLSAISLLLPTGRVLGLDGLFRRRVPTAGAGRRGVRSRTASGRAHAPRA